MRGQYSISSTNQIKCMILTGYLTNTMAKKPHRKTCCFIIGISNVSAMPFGTAGRTKCHLLTSLLAAKYALHSLLTFSPEQLAQKSIILLK